MSDPKLGQQVIIIDGTYDGLTGDVVSDNPGPSRTYLLVVHIAGLGDVQVPSWQVEPTASSSERSATVISRVRL